MNSNSEISCPILFMTFNRFDLTKEVFKEIRKAKPKNLFISSDGPRKNRPGEKKLIKEIRKWILDNIDWKCNVKTLFREKNLGCEKSCYGAISWFFKSVEYGLILEDDCLPSQSFFIFCQELLEKYKDDSRVSSVMGMTTLPSFAMKPSYKFIKYTGLWGWASWRRVWQNVYDKELKIIEREDPKQYMKKLLPNNFERIFFEKRFFDYRAKRVSTWEFPWIFGQIRSRGLTILPKKNMILNIGIDKGFTNTKPNFIDEKFMTPPKTETDFPLIHPKKVVLNKNLGYLLLFRDMIRVVIKKTAGLFGIG